MTSRLGSALGLLEGPGYEERVGENATNIFITGKQGAGKSTLGMNIKKLYPSSVVIPILSTVPWENVEFPEEKIRLSDEELLSWCLHGKVLLRTLRKSRDRDGEWWKATQPPQDWEPPSPDTLYRIFIMGPDSALLLADYLQLPNQVMVFLTAKEFTVNRRMSRRASKPFFSERSPPRHGMCSLGVDPVNLIDKKPKIYDRLSARKQKTSGRSR